MMRLLEKGDKVSKAFDMYQMVFTPFQRGLIEAGEEAGQLAKCLGVLAEYEARCHAVRAKVVAALAYPATVTTFVILILFLGLPLFIAPGYLQLLTLLQGDMDGWLVGLVAFLHWTQTPSYWVCFWVPVGLALGWWLLPKSPR